MSSYKKAILNWKQMKVLRRGSTMDQSSSTFRTGPLSTL